MKKFACLVLAFCMIFGLMNLAAADGVPADQIKVGMICIGDENDGYSENHINGLKVAQEALGLNDSQLIFKYNIPETEAAYDAAIDLAEQGCNIIFAISFGHESHVFLAAEEYPEIQFCHATGVTASSSELANVHNYFPAICESRYVAGIAAGMKLNQMIEEGKITADTAKIGYVGAKPFAEIISGYTAFFLGARSVCPSATMDVIYTGEWSDMALEKETAEALIAQGAVLLSQHSDTNGPAQTAEAAGVPFVGYNVSMIETAPTTAVTSAACIWGAYYTQAVESVINGTELAKDWCGGYADGAVRLTELNEAVAAPGTAEACAEAEAKLMSGELKVFDTATFTVNGAQLTEADSPLVSDGYFHESVNASAPAFDFIIDGITLK